MTLPYPDDCGIDRKVIQQLFIRICRDSGFTLNAVEAMRLTARILNLHPLYILFALPPMWVADEIAAGTHPACSTSSQGG